LTHELGGRQLVHEGAADGGIKTPVEVLQRPQFPELSGFGATFDLALLTHVQFVLQEEFEELSMGQLMGLGLLEAHFQTGEQPGEQQLAGGGGEGVIHDGYG